MSGTRNVTNPFGPPGPSPAMVGLNTTTMPNVRHGASSTFPGTVTDDDIGKQLSHNFKTLLGPDVNITFNTNSGEYTTYRGLPQNTTGIPLAVHGRADVVSSDITTWISIFSDPIRVILPLKFTDTLVTVVQNRQLVHAPAIISAERTLAKTVSIIYSSRKVHMKRLAIDFLVNTNIFNEMASAIREIEFKLKGVKLSLERTIVSIAYKEVLTHGVKLIDAMMKGSHANANLKSEDIIRRADRMYVQSICGVLHKRAGVKNLMLSIQKANCYTPGGDTREPMQVAILPNHIGHLEYTKPEKVNFYISGVSDKDTSLPVGCETPAYTSSEWGGLKVLPYTPPPGYSRGIGGHAEPNEHELSRTMYFGTYYIEKDKNILPHDHTKADESINTIPCTITDFTQQQWYTLPRACILDNLENAKARASTVTFDNNYTTINEVNPCMGKFFTKDDPNAGDITADSKKEYVFWWGRPSMGVRTETGILATNPGHDTAEILVAFPSTKMCAAETVDEARGMVRTWAGCVIKRPENFLILNDLRFCGIVKGGGVNYRTHGKYNEGVDLMLFITKAQPNDTALWKDPDFEAQCKEYGIYTNIFNYINKKSATKQDDVKAMILYPGTLYDPRNNKIRSRNRGHLQTLDHPDNVGVIDGHQAYADTEAAFVNT